MEVTIRPIRPDDAPRLQEAFDRLSPESIYLRFLEPYKELSDRQAQRFANLDYRTQMALVASIPEHGEEHLIGVARYAMVGEEHPGVAESAIVVVDSFQNRGLGTLLLSRLVRYALAHGVRHFLATVHQTNAPIVRFIQRSRLDFDRRMLEPGVWEISIHLGELQEDA